MATATSLLRRAPETAPHPRLLWTPQRPPCLGCNRAGYNQGGAHAGSRRHSENAHLHGGGREVSAGRKRREARGEGWWTPGTSRLRFLIYMWMCGVFFAARAFSSSRRRGLLSSCGVLASHCGGFSLQSTGSRHTGFSSFGLRALEHAGFMSCDSRAPELGLCSGGTQAWLLHSLWGLPGPEIEPVSPALAG